MSSTIGSKLILVAAVSLDGFIADPSGQVGPLFDWYGNGDVEITLGDEERVFRTTQASAEYIESSRARFGACVVGRRLFDLTNGWGGRPPAGDSVFVVTHRPPTDWPFPEAPFTFVNDGIASAVEQARAAASGRAASSHDVSIAAGDVGGQALAAGLVDEVHLNLVPVVLGDGIRFFGMHPVDDPMLLENPRVIEGDRVTHLIYEIQRR